MLRDIDEKIEKTVLEEDAGKAENQPEQIPYFKMLLAYADSCDKIYLFVGWTLALITGAGLPAFSLLFGDLVDGTGQIDNDLIT